METNVTPKPAVKCRCCGEIMGADWQQNLIPGKTGYFLLTCRNRACEMNDYTFGEQSYPAIDLREYCKDQSK